MVQIAQDKVTEVVCAPQVMDGGSLEVPSSSELSGLPINRHCIKGILLYVIQTRGVNKMISLFNKHFLQQALILMTVQYLRATQEYVHIKI